MALLELCEEVFGTADLYQVLGVRREASDGEVRRGYHKVSLQVHPDRVGEGDKEDATRRFQILGRVYSVLSDKEQRAVYDEQGTVDEDATGLNQDRDWEAYWRLLFKKISLEDIQAFEKTYKGSEEELADIKQAYLDFKGDMDQIMESVLCVQYTDEPRIRNIIQQAIDAREVPSYKAFVKESKQKMNARKRRAQEEAKEAEVSRKELGLDEGVDNLKALIQIVRKFFLPLVHPPNGCYGQSYADPKPGAKCFFLVSHAGAGTQAPGSSSTAFPGHSRELDWKRSSRD
ncbi:dnaJ homolog subfamily C member 9 isoform X1 [Lepus europaeus]|uniref:dnaJ homolog subfamily C member 9 isoform X1 n=1 Tax=Lepus europaeus TaxID=9983 RepID=UPI002B488CCA|nr:dnaJ homolog subfamily C member 9 isoform X1 [Lepus europaeus]